MLTTHHNYCTSPLYVEDGGSVPDDSLAIAVDTYPSMNPLTVQLMQRLKLFDAACIQCSEDFTTVSVVGEKEPAERAGDAFVSKYQDLILGKRIITETAFTYQLTEEQYAVLLSEIEDQHPEVLCQAQFAQQSMVLSALEWSKLLKAKQHITSFSPGMPLPAVLPRPSHTTPQHTSPRDTTLSLPNGGMLTVKRGDLLKEKVTAIVNAANERLDHIGGAAFAIDRASGGNVQRESRKIIQKSGHVPTGQVAVTGAGGRLQCQCVIHAVGPDANSRPHKECEQLLKLVCENVLCTAEAQGMVSIALPAISSGIYAMKKEVVAQILISTILHYPYQHSSSVKDIRIVLFEEETLRPFLQFASEAKKSMPPGTAQQVVPVPQAPRSPDVVEIPLEKTHRKMVIKKAHFIYEDADIKVAAICSELGFQTGSNKELDGHLKGQLSEAVRGRYQYRRPDKFDVFTVYVQHATFGCRYLVIVNLLDRSLGTRHDGHKYLQQIVQSVCQEADTLEMPSVFIAPSTFSVGGFQSESILPAFIRMINHFKFTNDDFLTDVCFLALDQNSFNFFVAGAERHIGKSLRKSVQSSQSGGSHFHGSDSFATSDRNVQEHGNVSHVQTSTLHTFNTWSHQTGHSVGASTTGAAHTRSIPSVSIPFQQDRNLTIKKGDLVKEAVVAIVNSTDEHLQHSSGVARAINEASGGAVQVALNEVVARMGGSTQSGRVVVTAAGGNLRCKRVIHVVWPTARERPNEEYKRLLEALCQEILCAAEERQLESIALPPIISGFCNLSKEVAAQVLVDSVLHYPYAAQSLIKDIRIVISDEKTLPPFLKYAEDIKKTNSTASVGSAASKRNAPSQPHIANNGSHEGLPGVLSGPERSVNHSTASPTATPVSADDVVEIPLEIPHRMMVIKKAHFIYEDADIKVAAICSELGFETGVNKDLDGHMKGQLSEAVQERYQYRRPDKFDVFTVHVSYTSISCRYLVIVNILDRLLGTQNDGHKHLQQILQAVCQEADTLEMPSVTIAPNTFTIGGFQKGFILPEFIRVISHFRFTNDDFFTDVRFLALTQDVFDSLVADAERTVGKRLSRLPRPAKMASQAPLASSCPSSSPSPQRPALMVGSVPDHPPASSTDSPKDTQLPPPGPGMTKLSEHVFFALACGDLCKVQADAIVVPVAPTLHLKLGVVQAVDAASGGAISRTVKQIQRTKQKVSEGTAMPVEITGGLPCKHIILLIRNAKGTSVALDHACREALKLAEGLGAHSVTFPPISSNKGKDKLAKCMMGAFASFLPQNPQYIVSVTVVVKENEEAMLAAFRSLVWEGTTEQSRDELAQQLEPDNDTFATPPDSPSQSPQEPPGLEDDSSAAGGQCTAV